MDIKQQQNRNLEKAEEGSGGRSNIVIWRIERYVNSKARKNNADSNDWDFPQECRLKNNEEYCLEKVLENEKERKTVEQMEKRNQNTEKIDSTKNAIDFRV